MKLIKPTLSLLLAGILSLSVISCGQIENGDPVSEGTNSSQPESSLASSSLPEEDSSAPESSQPTENNSQTEVLSSENSQTESRTYTQEGQEAINDFITFDSNLISFVGQEEFEAWARTFYAQDKQEEFEAWARTFYAQDKPENVKTFIDYFQIEYDAFGGIFETDYNERQTDLNAAGYHSAEEYIHSYYTDEELNALFYGDEAAIREAFNLPADYPVF